MSIASLKRKNGRPSKMGQLQIQREIRPYFEKGISASITSEKTCINIKTVCKYFDFWTQEIYEQETSDLLERQREERIRIIVTFDNLILEAHKYLDDIKNQINQLQKEKKTIPLKLFSLRIDALRYIAEQVKTKGGFTMHPTMDDVSRKENGGK